MVGGTFRFSVQLRTRPVQNDRQAKNSSEADKGACLTRFGVRLPPLSQSEAHLDLLRGAVRVLGELAGNAVQLSGGTRLLPDGDMIIVDAAGNGHRLTGKTPTYERRTDPAALVIGVN